MKRKLLLLGIALSVAMLSCCSTATSPGNGSTKTPSGVTATPVSTSEVDISWSAVSDATSYNLYYSTTSGVTTATGTKIFNVTSSYKHTALTTGTTYYYLITAVTTSGESEASAQVSATPAPFISAQIFTNASDNSSLHETVYVFNDSSGSTPISTATVKVNGTTFSYNATNFDYEGSVTIATNAVISLLVTLTGDAVQYTSSGT